MSIVRTKANVRPIDPRSCFIVNDVAYHATIEAGQVVYHDGTGWAVAIVSNGSCEGKLLGVALHDGASGNTGKDVLIFGRLTGWTGLADGTQLYTAAAGEINDQASPANSIPIGYSVSDTDWFFMGALRAAETS